MGNQESGGKRYERSLLLTCPQGQVELARTPAASSSRVLRTIYGFAGTCDSAAARPDGNKKPLEPFSKILARQPGGVHEPKIVHASQFNFEALEQFLRSVVQL
jgi:hypothetical protein